MTEKPPMLTFTECATDAGIPITWIEDHARQYGLRVHKFGRYCRVDPEDWEAFKTQMAG